MSEAQEAPNANASASERGECLCCRIQKAAEEIIALFVPPQPVNKHFHEARIEVLRGIREMIDYRIEALSRANKAQGSRIVVE